ncbi:MAG: hypothetical protein EZS28_007312 [Streblomastix strix]|uniref:Uncharacterized protein n=1 Tax=Streblomastix strix TaxID=222440 RepID=A0A5J4WQ97_9EUKA|nr:MAG: hypothetical protein EZS28_007312 [Streblomastix strix]
MDRQITETIPKRRQSTTYKSIKRAEDSRGISKLSTTLSNNRVDKAILTILYFRILNKSNDIARYVTSCPPKICIPTRGEIEVRREFPRELMDRQSGMVLKLLSTSCVYEYEEEIDE